MAKSDTTAGNGANGGTAKRAASGASPATTPAKKTPTAKKSAAKKSAAKTASTANVGAGGPLTSGGTSTAEVASVAKKAPAKKTSARKTATVAAPAPRGATVEKTTRKSRRATAEDVAATAAVAVAGTAAAAGVANLAGDLVGHLRDFVTRFRGGWGHQEWTGLLDDLRGKGHDVSDEAGVGMQLERERLVHVLEGVPGMTPAKVRTVAGHYGTLWSFRNADVAEVAALPGMTRALAERAVGAAA